MQGNFTQQAVKTPEERVPFVKHSISDLCVEATNKRRILNIFRPFEKEYRRLIVEQRMRI
jgi:hypothetical protein